MTLNSCIFLADACLLLLLEYLGSRVSSVGRQLYNFLSDQMFLLGKKVDDETVLAQLHLIAKVSSHFKCNPLNWIKRL